MISLYTHFNYWASLIYINVFAVRQLLLSACYCSIAHTYTSSAILNQPIFNNTAYQFIVLSPNMAIYGSYVAIAIHSL